MKKATTAQIGAIGAMCAKLKLNADSKQAMVSSFTNGRETSSKELSIEEATAMIKALKVMIPEDKNTAKMTGKIFYYAHEMGWTKVNFNKKIVADGQRVDGWMINHSYLKKKLNKYTYAELPKLVSQFEMVYKDFLKHI